MKKLTTEQFVKYCNKIHKNKYDYSLVVYEGCYIKVKIVCPVHGEFLQVPANHSTGIGCPKCANEIKRSTNQYFIKKCEEVHNHKYDYSLVNYIGYEYKVKIICPFHGEFLQLAKHHLGGHGCPKCANENKILTNEKFIVKANLVHKGKYDYSLVNYKKSNIKVTIICPKHGEFKQRAGSHLQGCGCPKCKPTK